MSRDLFNDIDVLVNSFLTIHADHLNQPITNTVSSRERKLSITHLNYLLMW